MRILLLISFFYLPYRVIGQVNYVLNPSLEKYDTCPYNSNQIRFAYYWSCLDSNEYWNNPSVSDGEPEYENTCNNTNANDGCAPANPRFYHYPHTGNGMAQVLMYYDQQGPGYSRDYLQGRLYKPLTAGKNYCVTFYVTQEQQSSYSIKQIGAYLDNGSIDTTVWPGIPQTEYTPQVLNHSFLNDTANWTKIEGSFTANGNEKFITIGNFFDNAYTDTVIFNANSGFGTGYYLIDDISVIESDTKAYAGPDVSKGSADSVLLGRDEIIPGIKWWRDGVLIDTLNAGLWCKDSVPGVHTYILSQTLCGVTTWDTVKVTVWPLNVENVGNVGNVKVFPNPAKDEITIKTSTSLSEGLLRIFDISGKQLLEQQFSQNNTSIHLDLSAGVYVLKLTDTSGACNVQRLIIYK